MKDSDTLHKALKDTSRPIAIDPWCPNWQSGDDESWMHQIRKLAPLIEKTERELFRCEAEVKRLCATLKLTALAEGRKTSSAQDTWAEAQPELFDARIKVGVIRGALSSLKVQLKAIEIGFEEWRTKVVNAREERKRYGA